MSGSKKFYFGLIAVIVLLCLAEIIGVKIATSKLSAKSTNLVNLQLTQQSLDNEQAQLAEAKAEIEKYQPLADISKSIVPQDKNQAETVREIVKLASASGINLTSVTFPKSDLGAPGKQSPSGLNLSQLTQVKGLPGVYQLPITITVNNGETVSFEQLVSFLDKLEHNRRTAQVTDIALSPDPKNPELLSFTLSINEYIKP